MVFQVDEVIYFAVMWLCTFFAGMARTLRDRDFEHPWDCISIGVVGGFYGFSVVTICSHYGPAIADFGWGYLGISCAIGTLGKEQDRYTRLIFSRLFEKFVGSDSKDEKPKDDANTSPDS